MIHARLQMAVPVVAAMALVGVPFAANAGLTPGTASFTVKPGESITETKTVDIPSQPPAADIELTIDTTGSMGPSIAQAKTDALNIVNGVQALIANSAFAVVQVRDLGDTPEYAVQQSMTLSATQVQSAVNALVASGGADAREAYNLVFHNSYNPQTGGDLGWRAGTRKFLVLIGDSIPHGDLVAQGFTSCAYPYATPDPHGFVTRDELAGMRAAGVTLFMIRQSTSAIVPLACYQQLAEFTGGAAIDKGGDLATQIVALIEASFDHVDQLKLVVNAASTPGTETWFTLPTVGPVDAPSTQTLTLTAAVPAEAADGVYTFDIEAIADNVDLGHQALTVTVHSNHPPDCSQVKLSRTSLWPPNHELVPITCSGATDSDPGDVATCAIDAISQDEPVNGLGDGDSSPDGRITSPPSAVAALRAERSGTGDGRFYWVRVTATDAHGATCTAVRSVTVSHSPARKPVNSGPPYFNSLLP